MSKLILIAAGAVGYVFGARAGKERYTEIKSKATELWQNPKVQEKKDQAQDLVKDKAPQVQETLSNVASTAAAQGKRAASTKDDDKIDHDSTSLNAAGVDAGHNTGHSGGDTVSGGFTLAEAPPVWQWDVAAAVGSVADDTGSTDDPSRR